jgi:hypothetical protein
MGNDDWSLALANIGTSIKSYEEEESITDIQDSGLRNYQ